VVKRVSRVTRMNKMKVLKKCAGRKKTLATDEETDEPKKKEMK